VPLSGQLIQRIVVGAIYCKTETFEVRSPWGELFQIRITGPLKDATPGFEILPIIIYSGTMGGSLELLVSPIATDPKSDDDDARIKKRPFLIEGRVSIVYITALLGHDVQNKSEVGTPDYFRCFIELRTK